jgi:hypothetical protein
MTWIESLWRRVSASAAFMRIFTDVAHEMLVLPTGALTVASVAGQWEAHWRPAERRNRGGIGQMGRSF